MNRNLELGINYYNGDDGYPQDIKSALMYFGYALNEGCYEAAYYLGLCYSDELLNNEEAVKYMSEADRHHIDDATEWLADYYKDIDVTKYLDYAIDVPEYLSKNSMLITKKLGQFFDSISDVDYLEIIDAIQWLEAWWSRIKDKSSTVCKQIATDRNSLLDRLCSLTEPLVHDKEIVDEIVSFLEEKESRNKLPSVKRTIFRVKYLSLLNSINKSSTISELEELSKLVQEYEEPCLSNLKAHIECRKFYLTVNNSDYSNESLLYISNYYLINKKNHEMLASANNVMKKMVEKLLSEDKVGLANRLIDSLPTGCDLKIALLGKVAVYNKRQEKIQTEETIIVDKYKYLEDMYHESLSQVDFNICFDYGWSNGKYHDLLELMKFAKEHNASFNYLLDKYSSSFLKVIIAQLPSSFFEDDIRKIKQEINERRIISLIHFSPIENRRSILEQGLMSRKELDNHKIKYLFTDNRRLDGFEDYICLSITNKNYKMLWNKVYQNVIRNGVEIYEIDPSILYEHPEAVVYCNCNASSYDAVKHMNYGIKGLLSMFGLYEDGSVNNTNKPTDVQAEILFKGKIDKKYIIKHYPDWSTTYGQESSFYSNRR